MKILIKKKKDMTLIKKKLKKKLEKKIIIKM